MFGLITLVFFYTTVVNIIERSDGVKISAFFISAIILTSLFSRIWRSTEIRSDAVEVDELAAKFIAVESQHTIRLIAHRSRGAYFGWVEGNPVQYLMRHLLECVCK